MDTTLTAIYCLADDMLQGMRHQESPQRSMNDAEIMTTALAAMRFFGGSFEKARTFLAEQGYVLQMLSKSQFNRRLHAISHLFERLFSLLAGFFKRREHARAEPCQGAFRDTYLIDSFPVPVCDNIRISQCRIYPEEDTDGIFRGFIASKKRFFYGLKVHMLTTKAGEPVEAILAPGSFNDTRVMKHFAFNLEEGSTVYGDKAYNDYDFEDELKEDAEVTLQPLRKKNSKRKLPAYVEYVQHAFRKRIETAGSELKKQLPQSIHAVTKAGFELKVGLFVLAYSFSCLL